MKGRKPTPTQLRVIRGNPGRRPLPEAEPDAGAIGAPPSTLGRRARTKWREMIRLDRWGPVLRGSDRDVLAEYCKTFARLELAEQMVEKHGLLVLGVRGAPVVSPWLDLTQRLADRLQRTALEFGGTPSSRTRVSVASPGGAKANPFAHHGRPPAAGQGR